MRLHWLAILLAMMIAALPAHAKAEDALYPHACVLGSARPMTQPEVAAGGNWKCNPSTDAARHSYLWLRIRADELPSGAARQLEGDAMPLAGLRTRLRFADGSVRERHLTAEDIAAHWAAGTRFSLPLYGAHERPRELYVRIDRPFDRQVATSLGLKDRAAAAAERLNGTILFGMFTGALLIVVLYSLSLFVALRARFALAHAAQVALLVIYTVASSSLLFLVFPGATLWLRTSLSYASLAWSMALIVPFMIGYLERDVLRPLERRAAWVCAGLLMIAGLSVPFLGPSMPFKLRAIYSLSYVPGLFAFAILCVVAWMRGSQAIRLVALAWAVPFVFAAERIARGFGMSFLPGTTDFAFYGAMSVQAIVMAFAIAWRIGELRRERDRGLALERELARQAQTDALTGLPNRRAFDERHWRGGDFLAVIDIDHFKRVNDTHGHAAGDAVLRALAGVLSAHVGSGGVVGVWRMGGEEFTVLVSAPSIDSAALAINNLRGRVSAGIATGVADLGRTVTVSAGLARVGDEGVEAAYEAADRALYHAKASGRDRLSWEVADHTTATIFPRRSRARAAA